LDLQGVAIVAYRSVVISNPKSLRGDASILGTARVKGATLGCDRVRYSDEPMLTPGEGYVFFLQSAWDSKTTGASDPWIAEAWPLDSNGIVQTPLEGPVPIDSLTKVVADTPVWARPSSSPQSAP
jgi:hypothetical protein